jgi:hypothetical protein
MAMAPDAIGAGTIKRLTELWTGGDPTLSVYLDLEAESLSTPAALDAQLSALNDEPSLTGAQVDIERVRQLLRAQRGLTRSARALAIFSCVRAGLLEAVGLPSRVEPIVVFDTVAWLEPLADMVSFGNWGVVVLGSSTARLFRGGSSALTEFAILDQTLPDGRAQLDLCAPCDGTAGDGLASHVGKVAEFLLRAHRRRPFAHLVIVARDPLRRVPQTHTQDHSGWESDPEYAAPASCPRNADR